MIGATIWITVGVLRQADLGALRRRPGQGGIPFWFAVDLVIVMPVSWLPLVADYNRFARRGSRGVAGTYWGYLLGNVWFYALGALLVLAAGATPDVAGIAGSVTAVAGGSLLLVALLVGESDNAFADIYSTAVSTQNVAPELPQRWLVAGVGALGFVLALAFTMERFELFLLLIGSVFVPLFGVFAADYFVRRRSRYGEAELFEPGGRFWYRGGVNWAAMVPWVAGFLLYHWSVPTGPQGWVDAMKAFFHALRLPFPLFGSRLGASLPSFTAAFVLALVILRARSDVTQSPPSAGPAEARPRGAAPRGPSRRS